jgi:hypothetical protein
MTLAENQMRAKRAPGVHVWRALWRALRPSARQDRSLSFKTRGPPAGHDLSKISFLDVDKRRGRNCRRPCATFDKSAVSSSSLRLRNAFHCVILSLLLANSSVKAAGVSLCIAVLRRLDVAFIALTKLLLVNFEQSIDATTKDEPSARSMPPQPDYRYV